MSIYNLVFAVAILSAGALSLRHKNALLWLGCITADYTVSLVYWRSGLPYPELVTGLCDAGVCLAIFFYGQLRWELWIWRLFQMSLLVNMIYLSSNITRAGLLDFEVYSTCLELINAAAITTIGGISAWHAAGQTDGRAFAPWVSVLGFVRPLYRKSKADR